jgi:tetratricopeptide (TPR) repeat protein
MKRPAISHLVPGLVLFAALLPLSFAPCARATDPGAVRSIAEKLERWDVEGAWADAQALLLKGPGDADLLEVAANVAFYRGDYGEAVRLAKAAIDAGGKNEGRRAFVVFAESTYGIIKEYKQYETAHFVIRLDERLDGILISYLADALQRTYEVVADQFGFRPTEKVRVELFPDTRAFYYASTLTAHDIESGAVGLTRFNKLMFLSPRTLVQGYRWLDTISHEYMHYMIMKLSANRAPIWFHEGLADHEETRWRGAKPGLSPAHEALLARALANGRLISFERMDPGLVSLPSPEDVQLAYAEAASAIDFIISTHGYAGLLSVMGQMAACGENGTEKAVKSALGWTLAEFDEKWKAYLHSKALKEEEGEALHQYKLKEGLADDDRMEMREIKSMVARNRAHIGDLLEEKGRSQAAVLEYRRALQDAQDSVPLLNRLSDALIGLGRDAEALDYLKRANTLDPDHPVTYMLLGEVYLRLKDWRKAEEALQSSIQTNPFIPEVHRDLAVLYETQGKKDAAHREKEIFTRLTVSSKDSAKDER